MIRTLLVDDEPVVLAVSKAFLENEGDINSETCESAQGALELLAGQDFDVIVSDYDMPGMDGIALLKLVRKQYPDLPFILLTGRGREEVVIEALNHGADFYLQKGTDPRVLYAELKSKIRHAVDRSRAKKALLRTQFSIDHLSAEFYWIDPEGVLIDVNESACRKLGYTREELIGKQVPDVDPDYDIERWYELWGRMKEKRFLNMESHHLKRDGTIYPVELSLSYCQMGENEFMCAFATDITNRKLSEEAVKAEKERIGAILSALDTGQSLINPDFTIDWVNQKARDFDPDQDPVGQKCYRIYEHRDRPCEECPVQQIFATGEVQSAEKFSPPHGRWYRIISQPVRDASGAVVQVLASFTDVSREKLMEEHLRESREQYRQWIRHSPYGTVIHREGRVLFCNRAAAELIGAENVDEVIGRPVFEFIHPDFYDIAMQRMEKVIHDSDCPLAPHIEERFIRMDGSPIDVEVSAGLVTFDGKPAIQVLFHDITERKQKEKERLALRQQLETEIRDLNLLHALSTRFLEGNNLNVLLQEILEAAIIITGADKGTLQLLDPATGMLKIVAQKHFNPPFLNFFEHVGPGDAAACGTALERAERVVVENICESPVFDEETAEVLLAEDLRAVQSTPLVRRNGNLLGIVSTHFCRVHAPTERELRLVDILSRQAVDMIEQNHTDKRLRESEMKYRELVENANSIILKLDTRGNITFINDFAQHFFGYTIDEVLGRNVVGTIVPEIESSGRDLREVILDICANPEGYRNHENENITKDGHRVWIHWTNRVIFDKHGEAVGVLCIGNDTTEQKHAEEALRESEEKYRSLFESSLDGILNVDMDGRFTEANQSALDMLGYTQEELTDLTFWQITPKCWHPGERDALHQIFSHGYSDLYEKEYVRKDGTVIPINIRIWLKKDDAGRPTGTWALVRDITEQKHAEEALRESEEKYRNLFESSLDGILNVDMDGRFTEANRSALDMLGYTQEEISGLTFWQITPKCWHPVDTSVIRQVLARGYSDLYEKEFIKKDGTVIPINIRVWLMRDDAGIPVGMWGIVRDITEQKRAEQGLIESEHRLNLAIESAHLGVWDKNLATGEVITHGYWPAILGYRSTDETPPWEEAVHPDDLNRVQHELRTHMEGTTPFVKAEFRMKRKEGRYRWIQSSGSVVERDDSGRPLRMIGVDHDITPLHASRESLKEANRKLNLLASITRHDILNQVSAQKAFLALLEEHIPQDAEAQAQEYYQHLLDTSETIRRQIAFTGDYQHMGEREPEWLRVEWVVRRAAESVRLNGIRLEVSAPLPEIYADPMLEKAFANLLDNATVHAHNLTVIRVSFHTKNGDGVIVLEDDGVGVPAAMKGEIFEKGFGKNTGYGLFLTREILAITGICIGECGEEGKGARFEIAVPKGKWRIPQTMN